MRTALWHTYASQHDIVDLKHMISVVDNAVKIFYNPIQTPDNRSFLVIAQNASDNRVNYSWYKNGNLAASGVGFTSYNLSQSDSGSFNITVIAKDNSLVIDGQDVKDSYEWNVNVAMPNQAPVLDAIGNKNVNEGNGLIIDVDASDANNDTLTYYTSASFGSFNSATGVFNWTPGYNDAGIYQVTFNVTDGFLWDSETINITVNNVNRQPVLDFISNKNVNENQIVTIVANASDADGDNLTYAINDSRFQQNGNIFTWQTDYNSAGTYYVLVSVSDGNLSDEQQVQVIVNDIPQYASLTGRIQLKGRENNLTMNNSNSVNVTMRNTANNQSSSYIVQSNYTGYFAIDNIIPGSYNIWVKPQFYLAVRNNSVILNTGSNNKDFGIAIGGDGNEDNKVSALDIAGFSGAYGSLLCSSLTYKWYFDFNSDCKINALDIAGFSGAYGSSGAAVV
jgi:hypothetical protein